MATKQPIIHIYKEINIGKYKSVKHYELINVQNGTCQLSEKINISKNRNFALSMPVYWLKLREGEKWGGYITGLFKTSTKNIFIGDHNKKKNLLIFRFSNGAERLTVYYFKNYYTNDLSEVLLLIKGLSEK